MNKDGVKLIDNGSMAGSITSTEVEVAEQDYGSIYIAWTGTAPVGEITVEAKSGNASPRETLDFGSTISVSGASGSHQIILMQIPYTQLRINYVRTSGTGTLNAYMVTKKIGEN